MNKTVAEQNAADAPPGYVNIVARRHLWEREAAICGEIEKRVRSHTRAEARAAGRERAQEMLSQARTDEPLVGAAWHPEGFDHARHYLACWAPSVLRGLYDVLDREMDDDWRGDDGFWMRAADVAHAAYVSELKAVLARRR